MYKKKKGELAFALFGSEVLALIPGALMSAIFEVVGRLCSFCEFSRIFWKTKVDLSKKIIPRLLTHRGLSLSEI